MSELTSKIRNNPTSFAKESDYKESLFSYQLMQKKNKDITSIPPKKLNSYDNYGTGGIPLFYDSIKHLIYVDHTDKHSLVIGSTGSKKSRLLAMPLAHILGLAGESMIISDPKAEIYYRTSKHLSTLGYDVTVINLRNPQYGSSWNPLSIPYQWFLEGDKDKAYEFAHDIAINLTLSKSNSDPFWDNTAGSFFFGLILLLFKFCKEEQLPLENVNIGNIMKLRTALCSGITPHSLNPLWTYAKTDEFIASTLIGTVETANDTRAGILSTFDQKMRSLAIQPSLLSMLSKNDINYDTLTERPSAIYLVVPDEKTGYHGLVSLFVKQSYEFLVHKAQNNFMSKRNLGNRVNYILDEFSSLPTINDFPAMITAARSRNIRFNLFLQSKHQLKLRYREEADTIMANCENWIFLNSKEVELLREISELCGDVPNSQKKPLLSTSELQRLDKTIGEAIIFSGRQKPFVSRLADIDEYDAQTSLMQTIGAHDFIDRTSWPQINFLEQPRINQYRFQRQESNHLKSPFFSNEFNIDEAIKKLDEKIKERESEENKTEVSTQNKSKGD